MKKVIKYSLIFIFWMLIWQIISWSVGKSLLLPGPILVISRYFQLFFKLSFWKNTALSILRIMLGVILGVLSGLILSVASYRFKLVFDTLNPFMTIIRATPVASFIILIVLFIGKSTVPAIISFLMVMPVIWSNTYEGLNQTDKQLKEVCKVFKLPLKKQIKALYLPSVLPYFTSAVISSIGLGWKAGIAAEILYPPLNSIGKEILDAKIFLETADMFAWTVNVVIISLIIEFVIKKFLLKITKSKAVEVKNENR